MTLTKSLATILDNAVAGQPVLAGFAKLKTSGDGLRNYYREAASAQCQILFYRDKWWTREGGTLYGELFCLVPLVQQALCGSAQSLATPDYAVPFHHFQFGLQADAPERSWQIRADDDVASFAAKAASWLASTAVPWFAQFETTDGVVAYMARTGRLADLALVHAALGQRDEARRCVATWLASLPRQIDRSLDRLRDAGLLSAAEHAGLAKASLQSEERYREMLGEWGAEACRNFR